MLRASSRRARAFTVSLAMIAAGVPFAPLATQADAADGAICTVTASPLALGNYDPLSRTPAPPATGTITYLCREVHQPIHVTVRVGGGTHDRFMKNGSDGAERLVYDLRIDNDGDVLWSGTIRDDGSDMRHTVRGRIPIYGVIRPHQNVHAGLFSDTISVSIDVDRLEHSDR